MSETENRSLIEYKVEEQGKTLNKVVETVEGMVKKNNEMYLKQELSDQKIKIYTVVIGVVFNTLLVLTLHFFQANDVSPKYTEKDKAIYYDKRVEESQIVKELRAEIERLKNGGR